MFTLFKLSGSRVGWLVVVGGVRFIGCRVSSSGSLGGVTPYIFLSYSGDVMGDKLYIKKRKNGQFSIPPD